MSRSPSSTFHGEIANRAVELLLDGDWLDYETVLAELAKLVPPGRALRVSEMARRKSSRSGSGPETRVKPRAIEDQIRTGQRRVVYDFLDAGPFEINQPARRGVPNPNEGRLVRMIHPPRGASDYAKKLIKDREEAEVRRLRRQVEKLRNYLIDLGYRDVAERIAPKPAKVTKRGL